MGVNAAATRRSVRVWASARSALALVLLVVAGPGLAAGPEPAGEAVVLLHGLGSGPWGMKLLEWRLERAGYEAHSLGYDDRAPTIERAAAEVRRQVEACCAGAGRVHFVTHSLGGLVLRSMLADHPVPNAGRAVLLAPPNRGSRIVDHLEGSALFRWALGPLAPQLGTAPDGLPRQLPPPAIPFGVIAGRRWLNPLGVAFLSGPHDGTVSVESTRLPGMADHLVVPHSHSFLMNSGRVAEAVCAFLATGRFEAASSETPEPGPG